MPIIVVTGRTNEPDRVAVLALLAEHPERALSREEIHRRLWGGERRHGDRGVDALVSRLRRKLEPSDGRYRYLHTRRGVGYCLEGVLRA